MIDDLPPKHISFLVQGHHFYPHLRDGEFAVIDTTDHQPQNGEVFLIAYGTPMVECGLHLALCQTRWSARRGAWMASHQFMPVDEADRLALLRSGQMVASEGPFKPGHLAEKLVGRVVGVYVPRVGARRASS